MILDDYVISAYLLTTITLLLTTAVIVGQFYRRRRALKMIEQAQNNPQNPR